MERESPQPESERFRSEGGGRVAANEAGLSLPATSPTSSVGKAIPPRLWQEAEAATQDYGKALFHRLQGFRLPWRERAHQWLQQLVLTTFMGDEGLRFALLRFVDVFPMLAGNKRIACHLREYLKGSAPSSGQAPSKATRLLL